MFQFPPQAPEKLPVTIGFITLQLCHLGMYHIENETKVNTDPAGNVLSGVKTPFCSLPQSRSSALPLHPAAPIFSGLWHFALEASQSISYPAKLSSLVFSIFALHYAIIYYSVKHVEALRRYMATFVLCCCKPRSSVRKSEISCCRSCWLEKRRRGEENRRREQEKRRRREGGGEAEERRGGGEGRRRRGRGRGLHTIAAEEGLVLGIFSFSSISVRFLVQCLQKVSHAVFV